MNHLLSANQIQAYQRDGYVLIENFLNTEELAFWRSAVMESIEERDGRKMPSMDIKMGEDDDINKDRDYYAKVFDGSTFNRIKNILSEDQVSRLKIDDLLNDEHQTF